MRTLSGFAASKQCTSGVLRLCVGIADVSIPNSRSPAPIDSMSDDELCYCFHVSQRKVVNYIRIHQPRVPSQISECGGAGTGCGWCVPFLRKLFDAALQKGELKLDIDQVQYARERAEYIQRQKEQRAATREKSSEDAVES